MAFWLEDWHAPWEATSWRKKKGRSLETKDEDRSNSCGPLSGVFSILPEQRQRGKNERRMPLLTHKFDVLRSQHEILSYASIPDQQPNLFSSGRTLCFLWKGQHKSQPAFTVPLFVTAFLFYPFLVFSSVLKPISDSLSETQCFRNTLQFSDTTTHEPIVKLGGKALHVTKSSGSTWH